MSSSAVNLADLGFRLRLQRRIRCSTLQEIARQAEISASYLAQIERGERMPSLDTLLLLCRALHTTADWLLSASLELPPETAEQPVEMERMAMLRLLRQMKHPG